MMDTSDPHADAGGALRSGQSCPPREIQIRPSVN